MVIILLFLCRITENSILIGFIQDRKCCAFSEDTVVFIWEVLFLTLSQLRINEYLFTKNNWNMLILLKNCIPFSNPKLDFKNFRDSKIMTICLLFDFRQFEGKLRCYETRYIETETFFLIFIFLALIWPLPSQIRPKRCLVTRVQKRVVSDHCVPELILVVF